MTTRTFVCRCEDVTIGEVDAAVASGLTTIEEIKRYTGLGTGPCQGRECLGTLARLLAKAHPDRAQSLQPFTARPPVEPVRFAVLAALPREPDEIAAEAALAASNAATAAFAPAEQEKAR
jgi:bacterioferritin-associated ferredoxin